MEVFPSALRHGVHPDDIDHALRHAIVVEEVAEDPIRYLVIGPDRSANLLEVVVLDRSHGPAVIHAMELRATYRKAAAERATKMPGDKGRKRDEAEITDEMVEAMAHEAEAGYDVEEILRRRGGRPPMGSGAASVESVRLDPELKRDLILRASEEQISVSEAIRRAVREYLRGG